MTLSELIKQLSSLLPAYAEAEVEALIDTPDAFTDGEILSVGTHNTKKRVVLHVEQRS